MTEHQLPETLSEEAVSTSSREEATNSEGDSPRKVFSCRHCQYNTDRKNNLKRHISAMHETTSQKLECCGVRFLNKADLKVHNGKFHSEGYKCPLCSQNFVRKALLERHFSVHTGEKKFACECGYRTSHKSNLERHHKTHVKDYQQKERKLINEKLLRTCYRSPLEICKSTENFIRETSLPPISNYENRISNNYTDFSNKFMNQNTNTQNHNKNIISRVPWLPPVSVMPKAMSSTGEIKTSPEKFKTGFTVDEILNKDQKKTQNFYENEKKSIFLENFFNFKENSSDDVTQSINKGKNDGFHFENLEKFSRILKPCPVYGGSFPPSSTSSIVSSGNYEREVVSSNSPSNKNSFPFGRVSNSTAFLPFPLDIKKAECQSSSSASSSVVQAHSSSDLLKSSWPSQILVSSSVTTLKSLTNSVTSSIPSSNSSFLPFSIGNILKIPEKMKSYLETDAQKIPQQRWNEEKVNIISNTEDDSLQSENDFDSDENSRISNKDRLSKEEGQRIAQNKSPASSSDVINLKSIELNSEKKNFMNDKFISTNVYVHKKWRAKVSES